MNRSVGYGVFCFMAALLSAAIKDAIGLGGCAALAVLLGFLCLGTMMALEDK